MWRSKEIIQIRSPFTLSEQSLEGYILGFESNPSVDLAPLTETVSCTPVNGNDKWTHSCQCCMAIIAHGVALKEPKNLSFLAHLSPGALNLFSGNCLNDFIDNLNQLHDLTVPGSIAIGVAGGYIGDDGGHWPGLNQKFYNEMVKKVSRICLQQKLGKPFIFQSPKYYPDFTDVYYKTQKNEVIVVTRPDHSYKLWGEF